mgnify:CR=1 FL=1
MSETTIKELDELAGKFLIGHKKLSQLQLQILQRIEKLKQEEYKIGLRRQRIRNLINIMYKKIC